MIRLPCSALNPYGLVAAIQHVASLPVPGQVAGAVQLPYSVSSSYTIPSTSHSAAERHNQSCMSWTPGTHIFARHMTSRVRVGVPAPRPEIENVMSTYKGGHTMRLIKYAESLEELDDIMWDARRKLQGCHIGMCAIKLGEMQREGKLNHNQLMVTRLCASLEAASLQRARTGFSAWTVGNVVKGLTWTKYNMKTEVLDCLADVLLEADALQLRMCADVDHANIAWGLAWQGYTRGELWDAMAAAIIPKIKDYPAQFLAVLLHSYGLVGHINAAFMEALCAALNARVGDLNPRALSACATALRALRWQQPALRSSLATMSLAKMREFSPAAVSQLLFAVKNWEGDTKELFGAAAEVVVSQSGAFQEWEVAKTVAAYQLAEADDPRVYQAMADRALQLIEMAAAARSSTALTPPPASSAFSPPPTSYGSGPSPLCAHLAHAFSFLPAASRGAVLDRVADLALPRLARQPRSVVVDLATSFERAQHPAAAQIRKVADDMSMPAPLKAAAVGA